MGDAEDVDVVPSGIALQQVSSWLGVDAQAVLAQETDPAIEAMFNKPHPSLLGLGAKYLSHKSMEASGLELRLKHKLHKGAGGKEQHSGQYEPAQLDRHRHKRTKLEQQQQHSQHGGGKKLQHQLPQRHDDPDDSSEGDEDAGKLGRLKPQATAVAGIGVGQPASKVLDRQQLLQTPSEQLSKWQRKRLREKAKRKQQGQQ